MSLPIDVLDYFLPNAILSKIFSESLVLEDICRLDSAISNKKKRSVFLECLKCKYCFWIGDTNQDFSSQATFWLKKRSIKLRHLTCGRITNDIAMNIGSFGSSLHWLSVTNMTYDKDQIRISKGFEGGNISDLGMVRLANGCPNLHTLQLVGCHDITDIGVMTVTEKCPNLHTLNLDDCYNITNMSIVRVAESYPNLISINLSQLYFVTDISLIRLAENCPMLCSLFLLNCDGITDLGIIKVAEG
jgi:hypothetical protein